MIPASVLGKLKTVSQFAAIVALIVAERGAAWVDVAVWVAVALTLVSGVDYFVKAHAVLDTSDEPDEPDEGTIRLNV